MKVPAGILPGRPELLALASGVLLVLSFPKFGHGLAAWVALVPLLVALHGETPWGAARLAYLTGLTSAVGLLYWTALVVVQFGGLPLPVALGVMLLLCAAYALLHGLFGLLVGFWARFLGARALLLAPVAWVASEILRAHTLFNFAWCLLGYSQHDNLPVLQVARWSAVYGVSFVVVVVNAGLALGWITRGTATSRHALAGTGAFLLLVLVHGWAWLRQPWTPVGETTVGLVQASIQQDEKWAPDRAMTNVLKHVQLSEQAAQRGARLVVWPESAAPGYYDRSKWLQLVLGDLVRQRGVYLLFGNDDREEVVNGPDRMRVGAKLLTPAGELPYRYHKVRLVPFGEYVPMQKLLTLGGRFTAKMVNQVADFSPGEDYAVGEVDGHRVGAFICYEAIFADLVREFPRQGAELLVNVTNDGWYGYTSAPYQHLAMARFRAVENNRFLVRAANTGFTAVVDPRGRILEKTQLFQPTAVVRKVDFVAETTPYARLGDVFAWACLGAGVALSGSLMFRRAR